MAYEDELEEAAKRSATGYNGPQTAATSQPTGAFDLEGIRGRLGFGKVDLRDPNAWLSANQDVAQGATITKGKMYGPGGQFLADVISNMSSGGTKSQFLDGIGDNGKPRPPKAVKSAATAVQPTATQAWNAAPVAAPIQPVAPPAPAPPDPRIAQLYEMLMGRAQQGLDVDPNNPAIKRRADAYTASEIKARRDYLADLAESEGPNANLRSEQRMSAETLGQRSGAFEAELIGQEIAAKRDEIAQALESMKGILSAEQEMALREKLAMLNDATARLGITTNDATQRLGITTNAATSRYATDANNATQRYGISTGASTAARGQDLGWESELLRNDQFLRNLGLSQSAQDRDYDLRNRGL